MVVHAFASVLLMLFSLYETLLVYKFKRFSIMCGNIASLIKAHEL